MSGPPRDSKVFGAPTPLAGDFSKLTCPLDGDLLLVFHKQELNQLTHLQGEEGGKAER